MVFWHLEKKIDSADWLVLVWERTRRLRFGSWIVYAMQSKLYRLLVGQSIDKASPSKQFPAQAKTNAKFSQNDYLDQIIRSSGRSHGVGISRDERCSEVKV